jgi:hypothetical protein
MDFQYVVWTVWIDFDVCMWLLFLGKMEILQKQLTHFGDITN